LLLPNIARCAMHDRATHITAKLERDFAATHHAQEPSIGTT
jgi:hypothetical protein